MNITRATLTVTGVTTITRAYNATTSASLNTGHAALVGVFSGDAVALGAGGGTGTFASKDVATAITVTVANLTLTGAQKGDYVLSQPTITGNITPASLGVSGVTAGNKVYDATALATLNTAGAALTGVFSGDVVTLDKSNAAGTFAAKNVGNNVPVAIAGFTIAGAQSNDYSLAQPATAANITPAGLTVDGVSAADKVYDATLAARLTVDSASLVGVFAGDAVTLTGTTGTFASKDVGVNISVLASGLALERRPGRRLHADPANRGGQYHSSDSGSVRRNGFQQALRFDHGRHYYRGQWHADGCILGGCRDGDGHGRDRDLRE